jgi:PAB1-binding protein PBP1
VQAPRLRAVVSEQAPSETGVRSDSAGARLLATQMAISGSSREEIERRLRSGFEIEDADAILDAILGPEEH